MDPWRQRGVAALLLVTLTLSAATVLGQKGTAGSVFESTAPQSDPNFFANNPTGITRGLVAKTLGALVLVVSLGVAALMLFKRVFPRISGAGSRSIRIEETALLGPHKYLHIVEVSHQRLLLGSTNDRVTMLAHLVDDLSRIDLEPDREKETG